MLACLALSFGVTLAQVGSPRSADVRPTFGRVIGQGGDPVVDATVNLVGGLPHLMSELQDVHVVRVATDKRGRAVAKLRQGLCYVAWAEWADVDGERLVSDVVGYFAAGAMFELVCRESQAVQSLILTGQEAWQDLGELRYFAMTSKPGMEVQLARTAGGSFEWPGKPFDVFEVRLPGGEALWHSSYQRTLQLPPPQKVRVRVVDGDGKPLDGARVSHRVGRLSSWVLDGLRSVGEDRMRFLGETDREGRCEVEIPYDCNPLRDGRSNLLLFVESPGRPAVAGGIWNRAFYVSDHKVPEIKGEELLFSCAAVEPLRGFLPDAPPGTTAHLAAVCKLYLQRNSYLHDARVFTAKVGDDGAFSFEDLPAELHSCRLSFVSPAGSNWKSPVFAAEAGRELPFEVTPLFIETREPLELVLLNLMVVDPTGSPARGAVAFLASGERDGILLRDSLLRVALDERGSARLRVVPGNWVVVVLTDTGFCGASFDLDVTSSEASVALQPLANMTVTLTDAADQPVVGARVHPRGTKTRGTSDPVGSILQGLGRTARRQWQRLRTDKQGRVVIPFVPIEGVQDRVDLRWDGGRSEEFLLEAGSQLSIGAQQFENKR